MNRTDKLNAIAIACAVVAMTLPVSGHATGGPCPCVDDVPVPVITAGGQTTPVNDSADGRSICAGSLNSNTQSASPAANGAGTANAKRNCKRQRGNFFNAFADGFLTPWTLLP